jgi:hypothetical protein
MGVFLFESLQTVTAVIFLPLGQDPTPEVVKNEGRRRRRRDLFLSWSR